MEKSRRFWVGVASKEHVENGKKWGICQFCHGKSAPASRLRKGDIVVYYSPTLVMGQPGSCKQFTAIGVVTDDAAYQVEQLPGFKPFRRNVAYFAEARAVDIIPLLPELSFIRNKQSWGMAFRYGFLEIDKQSFEVIARAMLGRVP